MSIKKQFPGRFIPNATNNDMKLRHSRRAFVNRVRGFDRKASIANAMNIRKEKLDLYKAVYMALKPHIKDILNEEQALILHLYLWENKGLTEIAEYMHFSDFHIVKDELKNIELRILALA